MCVCEKESRDRRGGRGWGRGGERRARVGERRARVGERGEGERGERSDNLIFVR